MVQERGWTSTKGLVVWKDCESAAICFTCNFLDTLAWITGPPDKETEGVSLGTTLTSVLFVIPNGGWKLNQRTCLPNIQAS